MTKVFISYEHSDETDIAEHLFKRLKDAGFEMWKDSHSLMPGDRFASKIHESITEQNHVIILLSAAALASDWVQEEIDTAKVHKRHIIPVLLQKMAIPANLSIINHLPMFDGAGDWRALDKLVNALQGGESIPRVFNASGRNDIGVDGLLVLGESSQGSADLNDPKSVEKAGRAIAEQALPYLKEAKAGLVTHGHAGIAQAALAALLGMHNQMPKLYWPSRQEGGDFYIGTKQCFSLQDVRDRAQREHNR